MSVREPLVSVIMPMRNAAPYVEEAVRSILSQSWRNLELLVFDDGSTDGSAEIVSAIRDDRIRLFREQDHRGIVHALIACLDASRGEFIARMDADDLSHPRRLEKQVRLLESRSDIGICGTWMTSFGAGIPNLYAFPVQHEEIRCDMLFNPSLIHGTVMFRAALASRGDIRWRDSHRHAEDYEWLIRLTGITRAMNIPESLYSYRLHPDQTGSVCGAEQREMSRCIQRELVTRIVPDASEDELATHEALSRWFIPREEALLRGIHAWLLRLENANRLEGVYDRIACTDVLARRFFFVCDYFAPYGLSAWLDFRRLELHRRAPVSLRARLSQFLRCLAKRDVPGRRQADGGAA